MGGGAAAMNRAALPDPRRRALDPAASVWVAASAGSGKTQLLSDRVIRLMLGGARPSRILGLTFTRAAAAEMATRINGILARYATAGEAELDSALRELLDRAPQDAERLRARRLFAAVLDEPGGLRIMTIHAFAQSLLRRFPLEAAVAPHFEVLDEAGQHALTAEATLRLFAAAGEGGALAAALARLSPVVHETRFARVIAALALDRAKLRRALNHYRGVDGLIGALYELFALPVGSDEAAIVRETAAARAYDEAALVRASAALARHGSPKDQTNAARLRHWLGCDAAERAARLDDYLAIFLTQDCDARKSLAVKAVSAAAPEALDALHDEQDRLLAALERRRRATLAANTAALLRLDAQFEALYAAEKARAGALDFADQIEGARALLEDRGAGAWVLYKLDGGLDHVLVDEAQDTAPAQWRIIGALAAEFYAGLGAQEGQRTLFAVGDEKQSIFSFQGADLATLERERERLIAGARAGGFRFDDVPLVRSFRSTAPVLALVDAVFADAATRAGVARDGAPIGHLVTRAGQAGVVELWPLVEPAEAPAPDPFTPPERQEGADDPEARLATYLARRIVRWLAPQSPAEQAEAYLPARGRPMRASDLLVLVRHRTAFGPLLVAALKEHGIPVAGVDRLALTEQLAVMDLMALGDALLLPEDDLSFATLLKSPLVGLDDDQLFRLAEGRGANSLWQTLTARREEEPAFAAAQAWFAGLLAAVDFLPPFELYAGVLAKGGRARLLRRLGPEANDAIDEFLALALDHERGAAPSLQGFLHWLRGAESVVHRDSEPARTEVRVMTVHGAKGLQAPVVVLPDTVALPNPSSELYWTEAADGTPLPLFPGRVEHLDAVGRAARSARRRADAEEYRRLLYVALTRAEDRLYVAGHRNGRAIPADCWYRLIEAGFARLPGAVRVAMTEPDGPQGEAVRYEAAQEAAPDRAGDAAPAGAPPPPVPDWANRPPVPEPPPRRRRAASARLGAPPAAPSPLRAEGAARARGHIIHRLLELLPEVAPDKGPGALERYLARRALGLSPAERTEIARAVLGVLNDPALAALFGAGSLAEVPLAAELGGELITGQVDRLAVTANSVLVIDYKTGAVPARPEAAPPAYLAQLAAYRAVLTRLYPGRPIACGLLYTDRPVLHWLQENVLAAFAP
jgi:ATP-dependent helicase/nuclease subunit A